MGEGCLRPMEEHEWDAGSWPPNSEYSVIWWWGMLLGNNMLRCLQTEERVELMPLTMWIHHDIE